MQCVPEPVRSRDGSRRAVRVFPLALPRPQSCRTQCRERESIICSAQYHGTAVHVVSSQERSGSVHHAGATLAKWSVWSCARRFFTMISHSQALAWIFIAPKEAGLCCGKTRWELASPP